MQAGFLYVERLIRHTVLSTRYKPKILKKSKKKIFDSSSEAFLTDPVRYVVECDKHPTKDNLGNVMLMALFDVRKTGRSDILIDI
jgi:hypothetical protein